jgi:hypothetical protein
MHRTLTAFLLSTATSIAASSFIGDMNTIKAHASPVPANGDVNPYGVAVVPSSIGDLKSGHAQEHQQRRGTERLCFTNWALDSPGWYAFDQFGSRYRNRV